MEWVVAILATIVTPLSSYLSWRLGKRKRNNDFLGDLQASIDLLSENYKEALNELTLLRRENINLMARQDQMLCELKELRLENGELKLIVNDLNIELKKLKKHEN